MPLTETIIHQVTDITVIQRMGEGMDNEPFWCTDVEIQSKDGTIVIRCHDESRAEVRLLEDRDGLKVV